MSKQAIPPPAAPYPQTNQKTSVHGDWKLAEAANALSTRSAITKIFGADVDIKSKPEALIVLQTAQIERLNESLKDYKCKNRQLSMEHLDRQSYEVQIRQLFERDCASRTEIDRLNKAMRSIITTSEQYRKQISAAQEKSARIEAENFQLRGKNSYLERELQTAREAAQKYRRKTDSDLAAYSRDLSASRTYLQSLQKNNSDLLARVNSIQLYERRIIELQTQLIFYQQEAERLSHNVSDSNERTLVQEKSLRELQERNLQLERSYKNLDEEHGWHKNALMSSQKQQGEVQRLVQNLQDQNNKLKQLLATFEESAKKTKVDYQNKATNSAGQFTRLASMIKDLQGRLATGELEQKRLVQLANTQENEWRNKLEVQGKKVISLNGQNKDLLAKLQEKEEQLKNKSNVATELEARLKDTYVNLEKSQKAYREANEHGINLQRDLTSLKRQYSSLQSSNQQLSSQLQKEVSEKVEKLNNSVIITSQKLGRISELQQSIKVERERSEKLAKDLKSFAIECSFLSQTKKSQERNTIALKEAVSSLEEKLNQEYQKNSNLVQQNSKKENLIRQYDDITNDMKDRILSLEKQLKTAKERIEELNKLNNIQKTQISSFNTEKQKNIDEKSKQIAGKQAQIVKLKDFITHYDNITEEMKKTIQYIEAQKKSYQQKITRLQEENAKLNKIVSSKESESELLKQKITSTENELRQKFELNLQSQNKIHQKKITQHAKEQQELKSSLDQLHSEKAELASKNAEQAKIIDSYAEAVASHAISSSSQVEQKTKLQEEYAKRSQQIAQLNLEINKVKEERGQLANILQNKIKENQALKRKMIDLQNEIRTTFEDGIQDLNTKIGSADAKINKQKAEAEELLKEQNILKEKSKKQQQQLQQANKLLGEYSAKITSLQLDLDAIRKELNDSRQNELTLKNKTAADNSEITATRDKIDQLTREKQNNINEIDSLRRKANDSEQKVSILKLEIEKLHQILNNNYFQSKAELQNLYKSRQELQQQGEAALRTREQLESTITSYERRLTSYTQMLTDIESEFFAIQMITNELKHQRDLLVKKNFTLVTAIHRLSEEQLAISKEADSIRKFFPKESKVALQLAQHYENIQKFISNAGKITVEEKITETKTIVTM